MSAGGAAAVSEKREHVSAMDTIVQTHFDASILQVGIGHVAVRGNLQDDVVTSDVVEGDRRKNARGIVWDSVHHFGDLSIRHGEDGFAPAPPIVISSEGCTVV